MRGRPLPKSCSSLTLRYRGALFGLDDWHCAGHDTPGRAEEWCSDDRIVVTRRGAPRAAAAGRYVDRARDIIARGFLGPLTVAGIAREVHCSPLHLSRLFRRTTGLSLYRAVVRLRLRAALERVLDEPAALATIALDCGFASHSHFTDAFRAEYGCAPSAARQLRA
jgi:AraC-like DNA-binding protein